MEQPLQQGSIVAHTRDFDAIICKAKITISQRAQITVVKEEEEEDVDGKGEFKYLYPPFNMRLYSTYSFIQVVLGVSTKS